MSIFSSYKKIFLLGFIVVILVAIPFSVYIAQKRQRTITKAAASTVLSFEPASPTIKVGEVLTLNIWLDPGTGSTANQVSFVKLSISFDQEKFTIAGASLVPNPDSSNTLTSILEDPIFESGKASISLSVGADPTRVVTAKTKIAIFQLKTTNTTSPTFPNVTFDSPPNTQVLSIASSDQTSENVLSTTIPATVTIASGPTPSPGPSAAPTVTSVPPITTPSAAPIQTGGVPGQIPIPSPFSSSSAIIILSPTSVPPTFVSEGTKGGLPPTGPGEKILGIGAIGVIFTIIGTALLILL